MGATSSVSNGVGGAATAYGQYRAGKFNQAIDDYNADVADIQGRNAIVRGKFAVQRHQTQVRGLLGAQRAAYAGQGVVVDQDTAAAVAADTVTQAKLDEATIVNNAQLEAWGFRVQAVDYRARGNVAIQEARGQAAGTVLSTFGRSAEMWPKTGTPKVPADGIY